MKQTPPRIILYGPPGTGKTALMLTLGEKLQVIDVDDGLVTGLRLEDKWKKARGEVDVKRFVEDDPKKGVAFSKVKATIYGIADQCRAGTYPFKALGLDSFTAFADYAVRYIKGNAGHLEQNTQLQEWGMAFQEIENVLTVLRSLPIVVIMTAHEHTYEVGDGTKTEIAIPGRKLPQKVVGYFDEVIRTKVRNVTGGELAYVLQTRSTAGVVARSRRSLPDGTDSEIGMGAVLKLMGYEW